MTPYTHLHFYQCGWCKTTATSPVYDPRLPPKCCSCLRLMKRLYAEPIVTDQDRELSQRGLVFNPYVERGPLKSLCDVCSAVMVRDMMIDLGCGGLYCSAGCADIGTERHRVAMERLHANLEELYQRKPYLRPQEAKA